MADRTCPSCGEPVAAHHTVCLSCRTPVPSDAGPVGSASTSRIWFAPPPPRQRRGAATPTPAPAPVPTAASAPPPAPAAPAPDVTAVTWAPDPTTIAPSPFGDPAPVGAPVWSGPSAAPSATAPSAPAPSAGVLGADAPVLDERGNLPAGLIGLLGALLVAVGVFVPWITVGDVGVSGWSSSDDAKVLVALAATATVVAALLVAGARGLLLRLIVLVLGVATVALAAYDIVSASDLALADLATGLFVVLAGGVALTVAGLLTRHRRYR